MISSDLRHAEMKSVKSLKMERVAFIEGELYLPGSKSVSNRALLLSALAKGRTELVNLLDADDVSRMLDALRALGVAYELSSDRTRCQVEGLGAPFRSPEPLELYLGNAGTAMRPLCAALCLGQGSFILTGDQRMQERPIGDLVSALQSAGARISYLRNDGYPPLKIEAGGLQGGRMKVRGDISSQFLSALLMAAPLFPTDSEIGVEGVLTSKPYVDLTIALMEQFGVTARHESYERFLIPAQQTYLSPGRLVVEGDASAASYFFAAAAIKGHVKVHGLTKKSIQGDVRFVEILEQAGARVQYGPDYIEVHRGPLRGIEVDGNHIPDAIMTLAVMALFAEGKTVIRNVANWRVKETDRLTAMATELRKVGATVVEGPDFIEIEPPKTLRHASIDTYHDHRMAMCFSLLALSESSVTINDPDCVAKTFPDYFAKFAGICRSR